MIFVGIRNIHIHVITHSGSVNIGSTMHLHAPTQDLPESILPSPDVPQPPQAPPFHSSDCSHPSSHSTTNTTNRFVRLILIGDIG